MPLDGMRADEVMEMMKAFALAIMENAADQHMKLCFGNPRRSRNQEGGKNSLKVLQSTQRISTSSCTLSPMPSMILNNVKRHVCLQ